MSKELEIVEQLEVDANPAAAELCRREFYFFVQQFWGTIIEEAPVWNWHIEYLCMVAQEIVFRLRDRQPKKEDVIVNIPPGTSKTTILSIMLPAWAWTVDPTLRILCLSYSDDVARDSSRKCRDIIQCDKYRAYFPGVEIRKDAKAAGNYMNTRNGQRYCAGVMGSITGKHFHLIVMDDPMNPKEAASAADCAMTNATLDSTLATRKVDKALTVTMTVMQRLSAADPTQHLLDKLERGKKIKHICLPAEAKAGVKPAALVAMYRGGLLDPIRLSPDVLAESRADLGEANYAGQFDQRPAPAGGLIWQKWFVEVPDEKWPDRKHMVQLGTDWDLAYTKDEDNAANAYVTAGKIGHNIYIDDLGWAWLEFPELIKYMSSKTGPHYIEAKASGKSAKQVLNNKGVTAIEISVAGGADKEARARMATPLAEAGRVFIRKSLADRLYYDAKQGILNFPRGKYKDLADALAQCLQRLDQRGAINSSTGTETVEE